MSQKTSKKRIIKCILLSILLIVVVVLLWIIRPPSSYNRSRVDKRLTSLEEPFKEVSAGYYQDGGSVSIKIVDKNDTLLKVALPVIDFDRSYDRVYFGVYHHSKLKEGSDARAENPAETKLMLEDILYRYSSGNLMSDIALSEIRGRVIDEIRFMYHDKMGHYDEGAE